MRFKRGKIARGVEFAGRRYDTVNEMFTHADGTPAFNSALPSKNIQYGHDKTIEHTAVRADRMWAVDQSHVVLDKSRRCAFVIDLDGWWTDLATLRTVLRMLLPPEFMPNFISYRARLDGSGVEDPHWSGCCRRAPAS